MNNIIKQWNKWRAENPETRAHLYGADLYGADLSLRLPVGDPRGYDCVSIKYGEQWRIFAGCRAYFINEAKAHWGENYKGDRTIGDRYLYGIEYLEKQIKDGKI